MYVLQSDINSCRLSMINNYCRISLDNIAVDQK